MGILRPNTNPKPTLRFYYYNGSVVTSSSSSFISIFGVDNTVKPPSYEFCVIYDVRVSRASFASSP